MIPAIGTPTSTPPYSTGGAALQGQLARYERELSACVNCSTAKTTEGKQKIQEVSSQIEQIKARIEQATQTRATRQAENSTPYASSGLDSVARTERAVLDFGALPRSSIGSQIDVKV
jgi:outer membrane murein-binding lipoprotein Lpp